MKWPMTAMLSAGALVALAPVEAAADNPYEVEASRAKAKYGHTLDDRDIELLKRYGCYASTDHPVCGGGYWSAQSHERKKKKRYDD